jgi:hypothetical protein
LLACFLSHKTGQIAVWYKDYFLIWQAADQTNSIS